MNKQIDVLRKTRLNLLAAVNELSPAQLNQIPAGFNNNIIWNIGHLIASQQGLCYLRAGLPMRIDEHLHAIYKPGTRPEKQANEQEVDEIKQLLINTLDILETDMQQDLFSNYAPWVNRYDYEISNIGDVLCYLPYHDGLHADRISVFKKLIA